MAKSRPRKPKKRSNRGPNRGSKYPQDAHFNRSLKTYIGAQANLWSREYPQISLSQTKKLMKDIKSEEIKVKRRIFRALWGIFKGQKEVMDLFAGAGLSTVPLVRGKRIDSLTMVDDWKTSQKESAVGRALIGEDSRFSIQNVHIDTNTRAGILPEIQQVVLADTGIALAPQHRKPSHLNTSLSTDPRMYTSASIINPEFNLQDILRILSDVQDRVVHVYETPFFRSTSPIEETREFIEEGASEAGWKVDNFERVKNTETLRAVLKN